MKDILIKMNHVEKEQYEIYIKKFTNAMKVFCGVEPKEEGFDEKIKTDVDGYINLMKKYIPDIEIPLELGKTAIKFFVIQEVNRIYKER